MVRSGVNLSLSNNNVGDVLDEINRQRKSLIELIQWGRLFGGSVGIMMFDNMKDEDYAKPIDISKLKKAKKSSCVSDGICHGAFSCICDYYD